MAMALLFVAPGIQRVEGAVVIDKAVVRPEGAVGKDPGDLAKIVDGSRR
jgi:hypothetical protein